MSYKQNIIDSGFFIIENTNLRQKEERQELITRHQYEIDLALKNKEQTVQYLEGILYRHIHETTVLYNKQIAELKEIFDRVKKSGLNIKSLQKDIKIELENVMLNYRQNKEDLITILRSG